MLFKWGTVSRINIKILSSQIYKIHSDHQESLNILLNENVIILKRSLFLFPKSKLWKMWALAEGLEKSKPWRLCVLLLPRTVPPCRECHPRGQMAWYMFMAWTSSHQVKKKKRAIENVLDIFILKNQKLDRHFSWPFPFGELWVPFFRSDSGEAVNGSQFPLTAR